MGASTLAVAWLFCALAVGLGFASFVFGLAYAISPSLTQKGRIRTVLRILTRMRTLESAVSEEDIRLTVFILTVVGLMFALVSAFLASMLEAS